jgi:acetyl/propionyl-CoA carboxylase alpha subunit
VSKIKTPSTIKCLVANRSEIACRVFQTCRELGIRTLGIVAPGDEAARHLTYADEIVPVSGYLNVDSVVSAARSAGATLVHPGYGFLSERSVFARAIESAGITFVGPTPETMDAMGGKIRAKEIATAAGVPTLPWARVEAGQDIRAAAKTVGFPLLLKAAAGGGGKGMRRVDRLEDLESAAESASSEAIAAFGDGTLFLERLVDRPRHIEVQVFGDGRGGGVHLYERECSLQRRHQKVWEEATAPNLSAATRQGLFTSAMRLVESVKYRSAGTLEYLVDAKGEFFFLEMNTRLQVEHPVTEQVTGLDLVRLQLEQALNPSKSAITSVGDPRGHSIEVRLYAEDPSQGFMPTPGRVDHLKWPTGTGIRIESGIEEGQEVGTAFDSMLAKIVVSAPDRHQAIERMKFALSETVVLGIGTNQSYLSAIAAHPAVAAGQVYTQFLETEFLPFEPAPSAQDLEILAQLQKAGLVSRKGAAGGATAGASGASGSSGRFPSPWEVIRG